MATGAEVPTSSAKTRGETAWAERDAVLVHSSDLVMYFDVDGTIAWASPATQHLFGIDPETLIGRNGLEMIHPDDQERALTELASITGFMDQVRVEFRVITDNGTLQWIEETATNLIDDPHVGYIVGNLHDITARKRDEEAILLQSRLLDAAGQAIVGINMKGIVFYWNAAATVIYGWTAEEARGRPFEELLQPADGWLGPARSVQTRVEAGEPWSGDFRVRRNDGSELAIFVTNTPVYDDAGRQIAITVVSSDITARQQHERVQAELSAIVTYSADAIFSTALDGTVQTWNQAANDLYGYSADEMIGCNISITFPPDQIETSSGSLAVVRDGKPVTSFETMRRRADGTDVPVSISISPMLDGDGHAIGASAVVRDITEQVRLRRNLEEDRRRLAGAQRSAHLGSFEIDSAAHTVTWSAELCEILGLAPDTAPSPGAFRARIHHDDLGYFEIMFDAATRGESSVECTIRLVRPDGEVRWVTTRTDPNSDPNSSMVSGTCLDVTDRKKLEHDLRYQATHDALTRLANRALLIEQLDAILATSEPGDAGVLLFDVDRFKLMNDSLGHHRGDQLLVAIADALRATLAGGELAARFGSDTFAVVIPVLTSSDQLLALAARLRERLADGITIGGVRQTPTVSVGMVIAERGTAALTALRDADTAMYRAKEKGRDRAEWFDPSLHHEVVANFVVERELRHALKYDELHLVFQPILDLETGSITSCESLIRWDHPERGDQSPDDFIPVAEQTGLIVAIGTWVLREALSAAAGWPEAVHLAVNLSPHQLAEPELYALVRDTLREFQVAPERLTLEITETAVLQDPTAAARTISALRALGVSVVIDDFGTGYTSLSFLRDYQIDGLKIDRSFVTDLARGSTAIVDAMIRMASALGLQVIAEGIETEEQLAQLKVLGCRFIQGYLVSKPVANRDLRFSHRLAAAHS